MSPEPWHARPADVVVRALGSRAAGLTAEEVVARGRQHGPNELPAPPATSRFAVIAHQFQSPLIYLLLGAAGLALALGETSDAVVIAVVVTINGVVGAVQEGRAERALGGLRRLATQRARVIRDGRERLVDARELVPGDQLVLAAGDAVTADARLVEAAGLQAAEAALTGESTGVAKQASPVAAAAALADRRSMAYAGTLVIAGRGRGVVVATGRSTELGCIAALAESTVPPPTPLERRVRQFGRYLTATAIAAFVLVLAIGLLGGNPLEEVVLIGISQVVGLVPEGLPVAMTIALAVGVQRMARRGAIVRKLAAVETLGAATVICSDKTGTLTRNEMTATAVWLPDGTELAVTGVGYAPEGAVPAHPACLPLLEVAALCNDADVAEREGRWIPIGDPTEAALVTLALKGGVPVLALREREPRLAEIPFDSATKLMATQHGRRIAIKGAPEAVLALCTGAEADRVRAAVQAMGARALRVLAFADAEGELVPAAGVAGLTGRARLLGLVGQIDPPRREAAAAVARCRSAGIRPVMITGDHVATGLAVARELGIAGPTDAALDGAALATMTDAALDARLGEIAVYARVRPEQKLRLVEAFQRRGEVVAMLGDAVNDAPALIRADVGVAMGQTGTDVAKEASKVVITDDNFETIVAAVEEGRVVDRNIRKAVLLLLATSCAEVLVLLLALLAGLPAPFAAVQILWNNLVTEGVITVNLIVDPPDGDEMHAPPRAPDAPLVDRAMMHRLLLMTPTIVVLTLGWFAWRLDRGVPLAVARSETFTLLVVCEWFNVLNCLSATRSALSLRLLRNRWLLGGLVLGNALQISVIFVPAANRVFHTEPFAWTQVVAIGAVGSCVLWVEELRKYLRRRHAACSTTLRASTTR